MFIFQVGDILNHIALNNAQLRFDTNELVICATKPIKKVIYKKLQIKVFFKSLKL